MDAINKLCDTTIKVCITLTVVVIANSAGVFNPIKRKWNQWKAEAEADSCCK